MNQYLHSLSQGLGGLLRFSGRSTQRDFWFYAATVIGLMMIGTSAMGAVVVTDMIQRITRFAAEHPDLTTVTEGPGSYSVSIEGFYPELFPDVSPIITASGICVVMSIVLLAAAVSRRLHDVGRSAFWGLLPLPFGVTGFVVISQMLRQMAASPPTSDAFDLNAMMPLFFIGFFANLLWLIGLAVLAVWMAGGSQPHANRHGPPPVQVE